VNSFQKGELPKGEFPITTEYNRRAVQCGTFAEQDNNKLRLNGWKSEHGAKPANGSGVEPDLAAVHRGGFGNDRQAKP
jgi:hypothetical protein